MSKSKKDNYPNFCHFDYWLIDLLQMLILENHYVCLHPEWSNTIEFAETNESFNKNKNMLIIVLGAHTLTT